MGSERPRHPRSGRAPPAAWGLEGSRSRQIAIVLAIIVTLAIIVIIVMIVMILILLLILVVMAARGPGGLAKLVAGGPR